MLQVPVILLANVFFDLAVRNPSDIPTNGKRLCLRPGIIDRGFVVHIVIDSTSEKTLRDHSSILFSYESHAEPWPRVDTAALLLSPSDRFAPYHTPSAFLNASILFDWDRSTTGSACHWEVAESVSPVPRPGHPRHDRRAGRLGGILGSIGTKCATRSGAIGCRSDQGFRRARRIGWNCCILLTDGDHS